MNHRSWLAALCLSMLPGLLGCGLLKKKTPDAAPSATAAAASTALVVPPTPPTVEAPVIAAAPQLDDATIPAPQDFEDEAFEKVTTSNFKAELTQLTKDVSAK